MYFFSGRTVPAKLGSDKYMESVCEIRGFANAIKTISIYFSTFLITSRKQLSYVVINEFCLIRIKVFIPLSTTTFVLCGSMYTNGIVT